MEIEKLTETLPFRLSPTVLRRLQKQARLQERKTNWLIRKYVEAGLERDEARYKDKDKS